MQPSNVTGTGRKKQRIRGVRKILGDGQETEVERAAQIPSQDRLESSSCCLISPVFWETGGCRYSLKLTKELLPVGCNL